MPTPRETILAALHARLSALPATALRGEVLPERVPAEGLLILRDGEPGEPEVTLSPLAYHYQHRAEIEAVVQGAKGLPPRKDHRVRAYDRRAAGTGCCRDRCSRARLWKRDPGRYRCGDPDRAALEATVIAGAALRSDMKDFGPSCFHSASTGAGNANAAPEGGA
jgi:hypothetical protein